MSYHAARQRQPHHRCRCEGRRAGFFPIACPHTDAQRCPARLHNHGVFSSQTPARAAGLQQHLASRTGRRVPRLPACACVLFMPWNAFVPRQNCNLPCWWSPGLPRCCASLMPDDSLCGGLCTLRWRSWWCSPAFKCVHARLRERPAYCRRACIVFVTRGRRGGGGRAAQGAWCAGSSCPGGRGGEGPTPHVPCALLLAEHLSVQRLAPLNNHAPESGATVPRILACTICSHQPAAAVCCRACLLHVWAIKPASQQKNSDWPLFWG